jgi:hypothetical protein
MRDRDSERGKTEHGRERDKRVRKAGLSLRCEMRGGRGRGRRGMERRLDRGQRWPGDRKKKT